MTALPWDDGTFDRVQFSDVIEHLDPAQTVPALAEFRRVLAPGGFLLVHTAPNLYFMRYGWPASRPFVRLAGHREIADKVDRWFEIAEDYHVNEQSVHSLRGALREAGFDAVACVAGPRRAARRQVPPARRLRGAGRSHRPGPGRLAPHPPVHEQRPVRLGAQVMSVRVPISRPQAGRS